MHIDELFRLAAEKKASDLHLVVGEPPILRIDGELKKVKNYKPVLRDGMEKLVLSIITPEQKEKFYAKKELDISHEIVGLSRYRVNLHWEKDNIGMVARVISSTIPTLEDV